MLMKNQKVLTAISFGIIAFALVVCTGCGKIEAIKAPCPVHELEDEIREKTRYRGLYHELEFFGICPRCA